MRGGVGCPGRIRISDLTVNSYFGHEAKPVMHTIDGARCFQAMVAMRDGVRLNTFVFLPQGGGPRFPVILHRTPYGIILPQGQHVTDCTKGWLPDPEAPLRGAIFAGLARDRAARLCRGVSG